MVTILSVVVSVEKSEGVKKDLCLFRLPGIGGWNSAADGVDDERGLR
jgi:hypothetical protein